MGHFHDRRTSDKKSSTVPPRSDTIKFHPHHFVVNVYNYVNTFFKFIFDLFFWVFRLMKNCIIAHTVI